MGQGGFANYPGPCRALPAVGKQRHHSIMTIRRQKVVELEKLKVRSRRHSHHRSSYRRKKFAGLLLLVFSLAIGVPAISEFAYIAFNTAICYHSTVDDQGNRTLVRRDSVGCTTVLLLESEHRLRVAASAVLVAAALFMGSMGMLHKLRKHKRRVRRGASQSRQGTGK